MIFQNWWLIYGLVFIIGIDLAMILRILVQEFIRARRRRESGVTPRHIPRNPSVSPATYDMEPGWDPGALFQIPDALKFESSEPIDASIPVNASVPVDAGGFIDGGLPIDFGF